MDYRGVRSRLRLAGIEAPSAYLRLGDKELHLEHQEAALLPLITQLRRRSILGKLTGNPYQG